MALIKSHKGSTSRSANVVIYRVCLSPRNQHCFPVAICLSSAGKITPPGSTTPLQELSTLSPAQIHTLRACSLLVIPPPPERVPPQVGFPMDLS